MSVPAGGPDPVGALRGVADAALAMNCISAQAAQAFCAWDGGRHLASEAQWEYAASGRGEERIYPWGDALPDCARAVYARPAR